MAGFAMRQSMTGDQIAQDVAALKYLESQEQTDVNRSISDMAQATAWRFGADALKSYADFPKHLTLMFVFLLFGTAFVTVKRIRTTVSDFIFPAALVITAMSNTDKPYISAISLFAAVILLAAAYTLSAEKNSFVKNISAALSAWSLGH